MTKIKKFFGITEKEYKFEWNDITALLTIINVTLVVMGFAWAPIVGLINCGLGLILNVKFRTHINLYAMQIALIILNIYFLTL